MLGGGFTTTVYCRSPDRLAASVTRTVKLYVPAVVGVPEITPALLMVRPGGGGPGGATSAQVYGAVPPETVTRVLG
jgi:hypothetical protein